MNKSKSVCLGDTAILVYVAALTVVVHWITGHQYGFHRDELATLEDARHLDWGFVAYPPVAPFFARLSLMLFGTSLAGFRFFAAVAEAIAVVLTGLMAREMGGRRGAQFVAAAAAIPFCLAGGALMQYVSFDYLFWVLTAYFVVKLLNTEDPRWWIAIGACIGLGLETKYTMGFFAIGIVAAVVLTDARRYLKSKWLWYGVALSILILLPNLIWQARNHFISLDFLQHIHARDVRIGRTKNFLPEQLQFTLFGFVLFLAGLYFTLFSRDGKRFRMLGWMYLTPLVIFVIAKGRAYYLAAAYPMLYAAGSVWVERALVCVGSTLQKLIRVLVWAALLTDVVIMGAITLPIAPANSTWAAHAMKINGDFCEELGWPELVQTIAEIRDSLSAEERAQLGILTGNYGEAGAVNLYGAQFGLPRAISGVNSFWQRGYGDPPPQTLIVVGADLDDLQGEFASCRLAADIWNRFGVENEETRDHPNIFVCHTLRKPWPEFWKTFRYFG
ncbi:MAG TPA: glycosyltransferase family 39 protein [Candidatus Acidoferrum sp.]